MAKQYTKSGCHGCILLISATTYVFPLEKHFRGEIRAFRPRMTSAYVRESLGQPAGQAARCVCVSDKLVVGRGVGTCSLFAGVRWGPHIQPGLGFTFWLLLDAPAWQVRMPTPAWVV